MSPPVCTKTFTLSNGVEFPAIGLGTWQGKLGSNDDKALEDSIIHAIKSGYRLIDTAQFYGVEHIVGRAIRASGIPRSELIIVTKFWGFWHHDPATALSISLKDMGLGYVDVFLMHWPWATTPLPEGKVLKKWESPTHIETWTLMEELVGPKCKAIGVSNFGQKPLEELLKKAKIVPAINQIELHALNPNLKLVPFCQSKGIHVMGWSTLGGAHDGKEILTHDLFKSIAAAHDVSTGVVSLSWAVQRGTSIIPKSSNPSRIEENIKLVTLTEEEMEKINGAQNTIKKIRFANRIEPLTHIIDEKVTLGGWTNEDYGWEDAEGNWLT